MGLPGGRRVIPLDSATRSEREARPTGRGRSASRSSAPRLGQLDGLRGIAVLAVLLFHTSLFPGGFLGVDLFFTLSGFVITAGLLREAGATRRIDLLAFLGRRARRLLPALLALLGLVLIATALLATPAVRHNAIDDLPWALAQLANWHFIGAGISYGHITDVHVFAHLWSIAVEWQFYLVWPVVIGVLARRARGGTASDRSDHRGDDRLGGPDGGVRRLGHDTGLRGHGHSRLRSAARCSRGDAARAPTR